MSLINSRMLAHISPIHKDPNIGKRPEKVSFYFENAEISIENQYATPFENSNPEGRLPNLMGMIQSGQIGSALGGAAEALPVAPDVSSVVGELDKLVGRTSFNKLNSQMIYVGSQNVKITGTAVFVALTDGDTDVEHNLYLLRWFAVPAHLSSDGILNSSLEQGVINGIFNSEAPDAVMLTYGGKTYSPLVIESLSEPLSGPMDENGNRILVKAQITLSSTQAWDKDDVSDLYAGKYKLYNTKTGQSN